eukprot:Platyproteum_vivax@DN5975_c0_g1_i2.p1
MYGRWLLEAAETQTLPDLKPHHVINSTPDLAKHFATSVDHFGDSFFEPTDEPALRRLLQVSAPATTLSEVALKQLQFGTSLMQSEAQLFCGQKLFVEECVSSEYRPYRIRTASLRWRLHGGSLVQSVEAATICAHVDGEKSVVGSVSVHFSELERLLDYAGRYRVWRKRSV